MTRRGGWRSKLAIMLYGVAVTTLAIQIVAWFVPVPATVDESRMDQPLEILPVVLVFLAYATVGLLILVRRPENRVGWLVGAVGFFPMLGGFTEMYVQRAPDWPLSDAARWTATGTSSPRYGRCHYSFCCSQMVARRPGCGAGRC